VFREDRTFDSATCATEGPRQIAYTELVDDRASADLGDDGTIDVLRDGSSIWFRSEAFPELDAPAAWIEVSIPPPDRDETVVTPFNVFTNSSLGGASLTVRFGPTRWWEMASNYERAHARPPQAALDGGGVPVGSIDWATDGEQETVASLEVDLDRPFLPGGTVRLSGSAAPGVWPEVSTPPSSDIVAFEDLPAVPVLETSTTWSGPCQDGVGVEVSAAAVECARRETGTLTIAQVVAAHPDGSWDLPAKCRSR
jgi:hypothetical protein